MDRSFWGPYNIFRDGPVHILPYNPKWHELFAILNFLSKIMQVPGWSIYENSDRLHALTKTNRENKNVKCNIEIYLYLSQTRTWISNVIFRGIVFLFNDMRWAVIVRFAYHQCLCYLFIIPCRLYMWYILINNNLPSNLIDLFFLP
jgi:hypothetical protein